MLYSKTRWQDPEEVGNYFIVSTTSITDTEQKSEESKWQARKNLLDTYRNMRYAVRKIFDRAIDRIYHSGGIKKIGMARLGFDNDKPTSIIELLKRFMAQQAYKI